MFDDHNTAEPDSKVAALTQVVATERLDLRPCTGDHLEDLVALWADPRVSELTTMRVPQSRERVLAMVERARRMWDEHGFGPWDAIERETGHWIGRLGLWELEAWPGPDRFEVGFELAPAFWRRGFASEGTRAALELGFGHGLPRIVSVTTAENVGARATMARCELTLGGACVWNECDVVWYFIDRPSGRRTDREET